jgi:spore coat protein CotH
MFVSFRWVIRVIQTRLLIIGALCTGMAGAQETANTLQDEFFAEDKIQDIRIEIHPSDWKKLQDNYLDNTYYPANLLWKDQFVENIGIRSKGRTSRRPNKPGLRVDINRVEDQEFLKFKSFLLDNDIQDLSLIKERLTMKLYSKMGLPSPRESHGRLYVNGQLIGVYSLAESTDKKFLQRNLGEDGGYLYEWVYLDGFKMQYLGNNPDLYSPLPFKPETNELNPDAAPIEKMVAAINQATDADFVKVVGEYLDLKKFITALAVESYLAEYDGYLAAGGINNFYFYRFKGKNLGMFLPKDKDNTFNEIEQPMFRYAKDNVLTRRIFAIPELRDFLFSEVMRAASLTGGEFGWMDEEIVRLAALLRPAVYADTNRECNNQPCTLSQANTDFEKQIDYMRQLVRQRPEIVLTELKSLGYVPPPAAVEQQQ